MGDPPNPARADEQWNPYRIAVMQREIAAIREFGALSGGWAWHFMSPPHIECKQLHDHKDIDMMVYPHAFSALVGLVSERGYAKAWTRFDDPSSEFVRFTRYVEHACPACLEDGVVADGDQFTCVECGSRWPESPARVVKVILDLFVQAVPELMLADGYRVVEPATLLTFYGKKHSSGGCVAVKAARELVARGEPVAGHASLVGTWGID
jgi:hypothetical protein